MNGLKKGQRGKSPSAGASAAALSFGFAALSASQLDSKDNYEYSLEASLCSAERGDAGFGSFGVQQFELRHGGFPLVSFGKTLHYEERPDAARVSAAETGLQEVSGRKGARAGSASGRGGAGDSEQAHLSDINPLNYVFHTRHASGDAPQDSLSPPTSNEPRADRAFSKEPRFLSFSAIPDREAPGAARSEVGKGSASGESRDGEARGGSLDRDTIKREVLHSAAQNPVDRRVFPFDDFGHSFAGDHRQESHGDQNVFLSSKRRHRRETQSSKEGLEIADIFRFLVNSSTTNAPPDARSNRASEKQAVVPPRKGLLSAENSPSRNPKFASTQRKTSQKKYLPKPAVASRPAAGRSAFLKNPRPTEHQREAGPGTAPAGRDSAADFNQEALRAVEKVTLHYKKPHVAGSPLNQEQMIYILQELEFLPPKLSQPDIALAFAMWDHLLPSSAAGVSTAVLVDFLLRLWQERSSPDCRKEPDVSNYTFRRSRNFSLSRHSLGSRSSSFNERRVPPDFDCLRAYRQGRRRRAAPTPDKAPHKAKPAHAPSLGDFAAGGEPAGPARRLLPAAARRARTEPAAAEPPKAPRKSQLAAGSPDRGSDRSNASTLIITVSRKDKALGQVRINDSDLDDVDRKVRETASILGLDEDEKALLKKTILHYFHALPN